MNTAHILSGRENILAFVTAGNATFTLVSRKSGTRFTYKARASRDENRPPVIFISVLTGSNNETDYTYVGQVRPGSFDRGYQHGRTSRIGEDAPSVRAFAWFFAQLVGSGAGLDQIEAWHEGRCGRCARMLTVPESVFTGLGPECAGLLGRPWAAQSEVA
jgi:hypothetical protein